MKKLFWALCGAAVVCLFPSCVVDEQYSNIKLEDIDTEMTLFQEGLEVPLGGMRAVTVKEIVGLDDSVKEFLTADEDGNYSISYNGTLSLTDQLDEALGQAPSIDGVKFSNDMKFSLGGFDLDQLTIKGLSFNSTVQVGPFAPMTIFVPEISAASDILDLSAGVPSELLSLGVDYTIPDSMNLGTYEVISSDFSLSGDLPEELSSVDKVYLSKSAPFVLKVKTSNLSGITTNDGVGRLDIAYSLKVVFPEGVEVDGHDEGFLNCITLGGKLSDGTLSHQVWVKSVVPQNNESGKVGFSGNIDAHLTATARGSFSPAKLKASPVKVEVSVSGSASVSDFDVTLNLDKMQKYLAVNETEELSFILDGFEDFGTFDIVPSGAPKAVLTMNIPDFGSDLKLLGNGLKIKLPDMMTVSGSGISGFNSADNTVTINGALPSKLEIPISGLHVTPVKNAQGVFEVKDKLTVTGSLALSTNKVSKTTLDKVNGAEAGFVGTVPDITPSSIELAGDFSHPIEAKIEDVVILDKDVLKSVPDQVKYIESLEFAKSNRLMIKMVANGLPELSASSSFTLKDAKVVLPEAVKLNGSNVIPISDRTLENNSPILLNLSLDKLEDIDLVNTSEIKGDITFTGRIYADKPSVDISTLRQDIDAKLDVAIGNGQSVASPGQIEIERILGKVEYDINETFKVEFPELPEVLTSEDIVLDLEPQLMLDMKSNLGLPVKGNIQIVPYRNGAADMKNAVSLNNVAIPYSESADNVSNLRYAIGTGIVPQNGVDTRNINLGCLVRQIPDSLQIRLEASVDQNKLCVVEPNADYVCDLDYGLKVPLKFGKEMKLSFSFNDISLSEQIGEIIKQSPVGFKAVVNSTLPVGVTLVLQLIDAEGNLIATEKDMEYALEASESGQVSRSEIAPVISLKDTAKTPAAIRIQVTVSSAENANCLNEEDYLELEDVVIVIPEGGFTYNPR